MKYLYILLLFNLSLGTLFSQSFSRGDLYFPDSISLKLFSPESTNGSQSAITTDSKLRWIWDGQKWVVQNSKDNFVQVSTSTITQVLDDGTIVNAGDVFVTDILGNTLSFAQKRNSEVIDGSASDDHNIKLFLENLPDEVGYHFHVYNESIIFNAGNSFIDFYQDGELISSNSQSLIIPVGAQGFAKKIGENYQVAYQRRYPQWTFKNENRFFDTDGTNLVHYNMIQEDRLSIRQFVVVDGDLYDIGDRLRFTKTSFNPESIGVGTITFENQPLRNQSFPIGDRVIELNIFDGETLEIQLTPNGWLVTNRINTRTSSALYDKIKQFYPFAHDDHINFKVINNYHVAQFEDIDDTSVLVYRDDIRNDTGESVIKFTYLKDTTNLAIRMELGGVLYFNYKNTDFVDIETNNNLTVVSSLEDQDKITHFIKLKNSSVCQIAPANSEFENFDFTQDPPFDVTKKGILNIVDFDYHAIIEY